MNETLGFRVTGLVQGVGFRFWAQRQAVQLGLTGFVRNSPDGSVEIKACGPPAQLEKFRAVLQRGPTGSRVEAVELLPANAQETSDRFEIRH